MRIDVSLSEDINILVIIVVIPKTDPTHFCVVIVVVFNSHHLYSSKIFLKSLNLKSSTMSHYSELSF